MTDSAWPDESEFSEIDAAPVIDEALPPDHRSGFVAVVGRPNVGKSTLMNHFLGQKIAIVSPKPQTTRNQLLGILTVPIGDSIEDPPEALAGCPPAQVIFVDTPGIHQPRHQLGQFLVNTAQEAILDADLRVWLVDAAGPADPEDRLVAAALHQAKTAAPAPVLLVLNKIDLLASPEIDDAAAAFLELYPADAWLPVSATRGDNLTELLCQIIELLPPGPRYFPEDQVTDLQTRFIAGELVREAALNVLHQEVPHALAVQVLEFKQRSDDMTYISANIIIERPSQKKIVIGEKGAALKKIGQMARPQIETLVGTRVYLELWVKVRPKWRKKPGELRWLGYSQG
jgi:GTP-binding protein Era